MSGLSPYILATCRTYFGRNVKGKHVGNRCEQCPLWDPCMAFGRAPARTMAELDDSRRTFVAAADIIRKERET